MQSVNHAVHNPARVGADSKSGLIHSASVTAGNVHDSHELPNLLHGGETRLYGDSEYRGEKQRDRLRELAPKAPRCANSACGFRAALGQALSAVIFLGRAMRMTVMMDEAPRPKLVRLARLGRIQHRVLGKNADTDRR